MKARCALLVVLLAITPFAGAAHRKPAPAGPPCKSLTVPVDVARGQFVEGLGTGDFRVRVDGKWASVDSVRLDQGPRRVVLMLDESGSMRGPAWSMAVAISRYLASHLPSEDQLSFVGFSSQLNQVVPFGTSRAYILDLLARPGFGIRGMTALWSAALYAASEFGKPQPGDTIIAVTDGGSDAGKESRGKLIKALLLAHVRFFAVGVYGLPGAGIYGGRFVVGVPFGPQNLYALTQSTGGVLFPWRWNVPAVSLVLDAVLGQIQNLYEVQVSVPPKVEGKRDWNLTVELAKERVTKGLRLHYPLRAVSCAEPAQSR